MTHSSSIPDRTSSRFELRSAVHVDGRSAPASASGVRAGLRVTSPTPGLAFGVAVALATALSAAMVMPASADSGADRAAAPDPTSSVGAPGRGLPEDASVPTPGVVVDPDLRSVPGEPLLGADGWRERNDLVGSMDGAVDILRWEAENPPDESESPAGPELTLEAFLARALAERPQLFAEAGLGHHERRSLDRRAAQYALDAQTAWIDAIAASQRQATAEDRLESRRIAEELAVRMHRVGNWDRERLLRQQEARSRAEVERIEARMEARAARETLAQMAGFWTPEDLSFALPDALPAVPEAPPLPESLEAAALAADPVLSSSAAQAATLRRGETAAHRRLDTRIEAAVQAALERHGAAADAPQLLGSWLPAIQLDGMANALDRGRLAERRELIEIRRDAVERRSQARLAVHELAYRHAIAVQTERRAELGDALEEEVLLRYNGMLHSTWDLLDATFDRIAAHEAAQTARADYWRAHLRVVTLLGEPLNPSAEN